MKNIKDIETEFDKFLPPHVPGCTCLLCEWRNEIKTFYRQYLIALGKESVGEERFPTDEDRENPTDSDLITVGYNEKRSQLITLLSAAGLWGEGE